MEEKSVQVRIPRGRGAAVALSLIAIGLGSSLTAASSVAERDRGVAVDENPVGEVVVPVLDQLTRERLAAALQPDGATGGAAGAGTLAGISTTTDFGLPVAAKRAYQAAARTMTTTAPGCGIEWTLIAGIGRVESDHGRFGGSQLGRDGVSRPLIRGLALNGVGPVAAIPDTDGGRLDGDDVWDRAVGPMQFIPSTWRTGGRDGDGDGVRDPDDLDDAALATADYLCRAGGDLSADSGRRTAVFAYNHSDYYVDLVLAFATGYATGVFGLPAPPTEESEESPTPAPRATEPPKTPVTTPGAPSSPTPGPSTSPAAPTTPTAPAAPSTPKGGGSGGEGKGSGKGNGGGGKGATPTPAPEPTPQPRYDAITGPWTSCSAGWCLSGAALDLAPLGSPDGTASADYDGDGSVETNRAEFDGLTAQLVTVTVERGTRSVYGIG